MGMKQENINKIKIMSFNVRCINKNDTGNKDWKIRCNVVDQLLKDECPDIIGFQETKIPQFEFLKVALSNYDFIYKRRDNKPEGEANPIFYRKDKFQLLSFDTFFLSDTYKIMSNTWGADCIRICTYGRFKDLKTNKEFMVFNTHLDHISAIARVKGVQLIKRIIKELNIEDIPYVITGDMNDFYNSDPINELFLEHRDASAFNNQQDIITFHNYGTAQEKIDYIALSKLVKQIDYKVLTNKYGDVYPSDHYPIMVTIDL